LFLVTITNKLADTQKTLAVNLASNFTCQWAT